MIDMLSAGIRGYHEFTVTKEQLASVVGSGSVDVFATPMMIAAIEYAASQSVAPELEDGQTTVGTLVNITHAAATPEGMKVHVSTELTAVSANGRILTFKTAAYDEAGLIGEGTHRRVVVDRARFEAKTAAKLDAKPDAE